MNRRNALLALGGALVASPTKAAPAPAADVRLAQHRAWVARCYKEIRSVRPGMTRGDLARLFEPAGGRYSRRVRGYAYKACPFFKISVTFEPADAGARLQPHDKILKVGTPYLDDPLAE